MNAFLGLVFLGFAACSVTKPCSDGGDVSWNPAIVGDKRCTQKTDHQGKTYNQGKFQEYYSSTGTLALEGEFDQGKKSGIWLYYAEDKKLISVKFFDQGVEKTPPVSTQKQIDLIIQQKAGMK